MELGRRGRVHRDRGALRGLISVLLGFVVFGSLAWLGCVIWFGGGVERPIVNAELSPVDPQETASTPASFGTDLAPGRAIDPTEEDQASRVEAAGADSVVRLTGRVVDERRHPITGATVGLGSGTGEPGESLGSRATSIADGTFVISLTSWPASSRVVLVAWMDGLAGTRDVRLPMNRAEVDAGTIVLLPCASLRVIVSRQGAPVEDARVWLEPESWRSVVVSARTNDAGLAEFDRVPCDGYRVVASTATEEGRGPVLLPDESEVHIDLLPRLTYEVRVLDIDSGRGIERAEVTLGEALRVPSRGNPEVTYMTGYSVFWESSPRVTTDADGVAILWGVAAETKSAIIVRARGYQSSEEDPAPLAEDSVVEVKLHAERGRTVRWPVEDGEVSPPAPGTVVRMRCEPGSASSATMADARMEGTWLVLEGTLERGGYLASTDDGRIARPWIDSSNLDAAGVGEVVEGPAISFRRVRSITVQIKNPDGTPAEGALAVARNQGNNDLLDPVAADQDGVSVLDGLHGRLAEVYIGEPGSTRPQTRVGTVDLEQGSATLHATLPRSARARIAMTCDGEVRLPAVYRVHMPGGCRVVSEDPERAEVLVEIPAVTDNSATFSVGASGYLRATGSLDLSSDVEARGEIALQSGGWFQVAVVRDPSTVVELALEEQDVQTGEFGAAHGMRFELPNGPGDSFRFGPLAAGVYRAVDRKSGRVSDPIRVVATEIATVQMAIDAPQWVSGRVEVPDGTNYRDVRVVLEGSGVSAPDDPRSRSPSGAYVSSDGSFVIRIPGDRSVTVKPWHPWLQPTEDGVVVTSVAREDVVLRLDHGPEVRIEAPALVGASLRGLRVGYCRGPVIGAPVTWIPASLDGDQIRFGAPVTGLCSMVVDPGGGFAPVALTGVAIEDAVTELGPVVFNAGSTLEVQILTAPGGDPPRIAVGATRVGEPSYRRWLNSKGEREVKLGGLGAGHFKVVLILEVDSSKRVEREVDLDGASNVELVFDLR